jgi:uncharacterized protein (TIGR00251 family)
MAVGTGATTPMKSKTGGTPISRSDELTVRISVRVTPRASTNAVASYVDGVVGVRLTAPPVEGAANEACCAFIANALGVPKSRVRLVGGAKSRSKTLEVTGTSAAEVEQKLRAASARP